MIKNTLVALMTVAAISGAAAPAFAYSLAEDHESTDAYFSHRDVLARLHEQGIEATSVESWGGLIRAFVKQDNGTVKQEFFAPITLAPVSL